MKFKFFDPEEEIIVEIDENKRVIDLIKKVFNKYDFYENNGLDICTVYDTRNYHVVSDNNNKIKDENLSENLCFAYYKKHEFLYVEGGWGHHMIDMDVVKEIKDPIMFKVTYNHIMRHKSFVSCKDFKFIDLYNGLINGGYIENNSKISIYKEKDNGFFHIIDINIFDLMNKSIYDVLSSHGDLYELVIKVEGKN